MKKVIITTGAIAIVGGLATAAFVSSCEPVCEVVAKPSVIVQIVDQDADEGADRFVTADAVWGDWNDEAGDAQGELTGECVNEGCTEWTLGEGLAGTYVYTATVCGKEYSSTVTIDAKEDGCSIDTQIVELPVSLDDCEDGPKHAPTLGVDANVAACTLSARPSVIANVVTFLDDMMVPLAPDRAFYRWSGATDKDEQPAVCLNEECSTFAAGYEQVGHFIVGAEVCGETITGEATVEKSADGCHVETQWLNLAVDASKCEKIDEIAAPELPPPPAGCEAEIVASAFLFPVDIEGDMVMAHGTDKLVYIRDGERHDGYCARTGDNGKCEWWIAGWGHSGRFEAFTEACGVETAVEYSVEMREDGCYPKTEHIYVSVDTRGCIQGPLPGGNPPPSTPAAGEDIDNDPSAKPGPAAGQDVTPKGGDPPRDDRDVTHE